MRPISKTRFFFICLGGALVISLLMCLFVGCKTRDVAKQKESVKKEESTKQESTVKEEKVSVKDDKTIEDKKTLTETEITSSKTGTVKIDSVKESKDPKTGKSTTTYYGVNSNFNLNEATKQSIQEALNKQNDIRDSSSIKRDSAGTKQQSSKSDSTHLVKNTTSKGSGRIWPWVVGGVLLILGALLIIINKKKPGI